MSKQQMTTNQEAPTLLERFQAALMVRGTVQEVDHWRTTATGTEFAVLKLTESRGEKSYHLVIGDTQNERGWSELLSGAYMQVKYHALMLALFFQAEQTVSHGC